MTSHNPRLPSGRSWWRPGAPARWREPDGLEPEERAWVEYHMWLAGCTDQPPPPATARETLRAALLGMRAAGATYEEIVAAYQRMTGCPPEARPPVDTSWIRTTRA